MTTHFLVDWWARQDYSYPAKSTRNLADRPKTRDGVLRRPGSNGYPDLAAPALPASRNGSLTNDEHARFNMADGVNSGSSAEIHSKIPAHRRKHTEIHKARIADILRDYPGAETAGFEKTVRALYATENPHSDPDELEFAFRPDAYRLNAEASEIEIYEIEVTSVLTDAKVISLGMFWFDWDCEDCPWIPVLILVDRYGHRNRVDLMHAYYRDGPFEHVRPKYGEAA